jgi:hypothetical protein
MEKPAFSHHGYIFTAQNYGRMCRCNKKWRVGHSNFGFFLSSKKNGKLNHPFHEDYGIIQPNTMVLFFEI